MLKIKLKTDSIIEAGNYILEKYVGISIRVYDRVTCNSKAIVLVESVDCADGIVNRIVINKRRLKNMVLKL